MDTELTKRVQAAQKGEITEHFIYLKLAGNTDGKNAEVLRHIAGDELKHYNAFKKHSGREELPNRARVWLYFLIFKLLGITFAIKLMENGERQAQAAYHYMADSLADVSLIMDDEIRHEKQLFRLINEERLNYVGSIVRGLNDALVELTGALTGLTLALQEPRLVAVTGLITGIAGALSMGSAEYLSSRSEETSRRPLRAALYTFATYMLTISIMILPYLLLGNLFLSLGIMLICAILIIMLFNFYISVVRELPFRKRFLEMAGINLSIIAISFGIGLAIRHLMGEI